MKRLRNTLYVTTQGAYLCHEGEAVLVRVEHETRLRVPVHTLGGIVCFGQVSCSPPLLHLCAERGAGVSFLSEQGRFPGGSRKALQVVFDNGIVKLEAHGCIFISRAAVASAL